MKKFFVAALIIFATAATVQAKEIKQGTFQLSGSSDIFFGNHEMELDGEKFIDTDTFQIGTTALYYLAPNVGFGLSFNYSNSDTSLYNGFTSETTELMIGPAIKGNIELDKKTNLFAGAAIGYQSLEWQDNGATTLDADGFFASVSGGVAIFPVDAVPIDLGVSYTFASGDDAVNDVDVDTTDLAGFAGLSVYF